jgi:hypothetical protein
MLIRKLILCCSMLILVGAPLAEAKTKGYRPPSFKRSKHAQKNFKYYKGKWHKTRH